MENLSFEQSFACLQEITRKLEKGDLPLEEALQLFEEGIKLFQHCQKILKDAEGRVARLVKSLDGMWMTEEI